jgi:hypothetical protein
MDRCGDDAAATPRKLHTCREKEYDYPHFRLIPAQVASPRVTERAANRHSSSPWVALVLVCIEQFMVILDATIVNVALRSI